MELECVVHDDQLSPTGNFGELAERFTGDSREYPLVGRLADTPCHNQGVVDVPQHQDVWRLIQLDAAVRMMGPAPFTTRLNRNMDAL
jgi:hypothetical protein